MRIEGKTKKLQFNNNSSSDNLIPAKQIRSSRGAFEYMTINDHNTMLSQERLIYQGRIILLDPLPVSV